MNILFVSGELIAGDLALQLQREGNTVRLYVDHPEQRDCLNGLIPKSMDWEHDLDWVGRDGLIVFDDVGYGEIQDRLRQSGYRVVGGSAGGDRLELDRDFAQKLFADCGMRVEPVYTFSDATEALDFLSGQEGVWVVKQNDHQSDLNYVGVMDDASDVRGVLESYLRLGVRDISLQRRLHGVEIGVGRYFNGHDWVGPIELNQEHKGLMNGELGPKTGEMGTLMWYAQASRIFDETLGRLRDYLREVDYRGDIAINCFIDRDMIYPIEVTARFGCPSTYVQSALHLTPWTSLLSAVADGCSCELAVHQGYAIGLSLAAPPYPYRRGGATGISSAGVPLTFRKPLTPEEGLRLHLEGVESIRDDDGNSRTLLTDCLECTAYLTGAGTTVRAAQDFVYCLVRKVVIPKMMYRTDIGDRFLNGDEASLKAYGWI
jgi:phosphoribosylamine--glycine ligase